LFENLFPALPSKDELRTRLKAELKALSVHERQQMEKSLNKVLSYFLDNQKGLWISYIARPEEAHISDSRKKTSHITWAYPVMLMDQMRFFTEGPKGFKTGEFNTTEPVTEGAKEIRLNEADGVLIPALGYDVKGVRLGRGKGHFDRALEKYKGLKVGISFSKQMVEELPREEHDVAVDMLITEKGILHFTHK
jgi:5-formyltetrahydrofolate cyclo-ligase